MLALDYFGDMDQGRWGKSYSLRDFKVSGFNAEGIIETCKMEENGSIMRLWPTLRHRKPTGSHKTCGKPQKTSGKSCSCGRGGQGFQESAPPTAKGGSKLPANSFPLEKPTSARGLVM